MLCPPRAEKIVLEVLLQRRIMRAIRLRIWCLRRALTKKTKGGLRRGATGEMDKNTIKARERQQTGMLMQKGRHIRTGGRNHGYSPFGRLDVRDLFIDETRPGKRRLYLLWLALGRLQVKMRSRGAGRLLLVLQVLGRRGAVSSLRWRRRPDTDMGRVDWVQQHHACHAHPQRPLQQRIPVRGLQKAHYATNGLTRFGRCIRGRLRGKRRLHGLCGSWMRVCQLVRVGVGVWGI